MESIHRSYVQKEKECFVSLLRVTLC